MKDQMRGFSPLIGLLVIGALVVLSIGYFATQGNLPSDFLDTKSANNESVSSTTPLTVVNQSPVMERSPEPIIANWKTHNDSDFGVSVKYPPTYVVRDNKDILSDDRWRLATLFTVYDSNSTSRNEFAIPPLTVNVQKQPVRHGGAIYRAIEEYKSAGEQHSNGELVMVNGKQMLYVESENKALGPGGDRSKSFYFIKDGLIHSAHLNADDRYYEELLSNWSL